MTGVYILVNTCLGYDWARGLPKLGGTAIVGPKKVVEVKVWGRMWPPSNDLEGGGLTGDNVALLGSVNGASR